MNTIFEFTDRTSVYSKCIFASICHAVMVGKYTLLSDEISWDGTSFLFQNMEGTRGVISFSEKNFLCGIQSEENYLEGENNIENTLLKDAELDIIYRVRGEIFPYLLVENDGDDIPAISAIFWGEEEKICSDMNEKEFMHKSDNILLPYLYEEKDMKKYRILPLLLIVCLLLTAAFPAFAANSTASTAEQSPEPTANAASDGVPQSTVQAQEGSYVLGSDTVKAALDEQLQANCVMLVDEDSGQYYYTRNIDAKAYPASLTKIMTLLLAVEAVERGDVQLSDSVTAYADCNADNSGR